VELDRWSIGHLAHPNIEILSLSGFEKKNIIAVVQFGELVQLIQLGLGVELGLLLAMR
jgi:hypothetical protein